MFLRILKTNQAYNLILIPIIGVLLWAVSIISPELYNYFSGETQLPFFNAVFNLTRNSPIIQTLLSLILLMFSAFIIQRLNLKFAIIRKRTLLPSAYFIILVSAIKNLHVLHPVYFALFFLLLAFYRMFQAYEEKNIYSISFDIGFLFGIASLFYFNILFAFPAMMISFINIKKEFSFRYLILNILGLLLPWIFSFSYYFFFDRINEFIQIISQNIFTENTILKKDIPMQLLIGYQVFLIIISSLNLLKFFDTKKVSTRRFFVSFFWLFIFLFLCILILPSVSIEIFILMSVPVTFLVSNFLVYLKNRFWGEIIFAIFIGLSVYMQFT